MTAAILFSDKHPILFIHAKMVRLKSGLVRNTSATDICL